MKIRTEIVATFVAAWLGLQGWTLYEISSLKEHVAVLSVKMEMHLNGGKSIVQNGRNIILAGNPGNPNH